MFLLPRPRRELASALAPTKRRVPLREMASTTALDKAPEPHHRSPTLRVRRHPDTPPRQHPNIGRKDSRHDGAITPPHPHRLDRPALGEGG